MSNIRTEKPSVVTEEARRLHADAVVIDGHNDLPWRILQKTGGSLDELDLAADQPDLYTDIPRLRRSGLTAQFWASYVPPRMMREGGATRCALEQIDLIHRMVSRYRDTLNMSLSADDIMRAKSSGQIASLIGVEGGHAIENSLGVLRMFHTLGVRYLTLTHNGTTDWCDAALDEHRHGGLNSFGRSVIAEMNRLGMMIDISHASHDAMRQAARISEAPIIASHAAAYGVLPIDRNIPDDVIELVAGKGGLIMMHFCSGFLDARSAEACQRLESIERELRATYQRDEDYRKARFAYLATHPIPRSTIHTMIDHIDHIVRVAGIDHVGLGSDYDGMDTVPQGLEDVSCYPNITQVLLDRGYPEAEIRKILGENLLRVLREVTG